MQQLTMVSADETQRCRRRRRHDCQTKHGCARRDAAGWDPRIKPHDRRRRGHCPPLRSQPQRPGRGRERPAAGWNVERRGAGTTDRLLPLVRHNHGISVRFGSLYKPCQLSARHHHHARGEWDTCTFSVAHAVRGAVAGHAVRCVHRCRLLSAFRRFYKNGSNYWRSSPSRVPPTRGPPLPPRPTRPSDPQRSPVPVVCLLCARFSVVPPHAARPRPPPTANGASW
jgi:hypothetical protein